MITDIKNVNAKTDEGKLLVAAIAKITTEAAADVNSTVDISIMSSKLFNINENFYLSLAFTLPSVYGVSVLNSKDHTLFGIVANTIGNTLTPLATQIVWYRTSISAIKNNLGGITKNVVNTSLQSALINFNYQNGNLVVEIITPYGSIINSANIPASDFKLYLQGFRRTVSIESNISIVEAFTF